MGKHFIDYASSKAALLLNTTWANKFKGVCCAAMFFALSLAI